MKRFLLGLPIVIASLFALTTGAWAETNIVANINHDFVASGKTFSAGTYKVFRLSAEMLVLRGEETGASVFLFPSTQNQAVPWQLQVKLTQVGDVYYLSEVETDVLGLHLSYAAGADSLGKGERPDCEARVGKQMT